MAEVQAGRQMRGILWEIQKTCWDHMRTHYGDQPQEITMSRRAYDALVQEAASWVFMHGKSGPDGTVIPGKETVYGMEVTVMDDTDRGFIVVGGTARKI